MMVFYINTFPMRREITLPSVYSGKTSSVSFLKKQKTNIMSRLGYEERKWFQKRGKMESIIFSSEMLRKLRAYFNDLDQDGSGAIGQNELQDPLITLEFCSSKEEVKQLIDTIDLDGSGEVEFSQFLEIFRKFKLNKYTNPLEKQRYQAFMDMFNTEKSSIFDGKKKSYQLAVSELRRKKLISDLIDKQKVKPKERRYQKKKNQMPTFLKKIQRQFTETPELNSIMEFHRLKNYHRVRLGKDY